jgi:hypothetical protein
MGAAHRRQAACKTLNEVAMRFISSIALLAGLALGLAVFAQAQPVNGATPQVDQALGDGWSRVHNPTP